MHWFKIGWIDKRKEKGLLYLHFTMDDNLSLDKKTIERYLQMYVGVFFKRYIKGLWAVAEGLIYTMCTDENYYTDIERPVALKSIAQKGLRLIMVQPIPVYSWKPGMMGRQSGLTGSTDGTAGQRRPDVPEVHRKQIHNMRMIWESLWEPNRKTNVQLSATLQPLHLLQNCGNEASM